MPPRLQILSAPRRLAFRPVARVRLPWEGVKASNGFIRTFADSKDLPLSEDNAGPNTEQAVPHVSEEAAAMGKITGGPTPDIEGQGTPVEEVVEGDKEAEKKLPKVMQESLKNKTEAPSGSRPYSTSARLHAMEVQSTPDIDDTLMTFTPEDMELARPTGHKFDLPDLPLPERSHFKRRYEPIVEQVTNLLMRDGKKGVAQRNMAHILTHLRTSPPPNINPSRPLLPGAPPPSHLPLNPILYLTLAVDSVAPLMRIRSQRGAAGGGVALQIPVPLGLRQRRRTALQWIFDAASKKKNRGSGKGQFASKVAEELVAVVEGRSGVWEKRSGVHRLGVSARANISTRRR